MSSRKNPIQPLEEWMPPLVGRITVVTHSGGGCRAIGLLPIAMPFNVPSSIDLVESESPTFATGC